MLWNGLRAGGIRALLQRARRGLVAVGFVAIAPPFFLQASSLHKTGVIDLAGWGPAGTQVVTGEFINGEIRPLGEFTIGEWGVAAIRGATRWSCERRTRRFRAWATLPDGTSQVSAYDLRTPSCRQRFTVSVRGGYYGRVRAMVRDRWRVGGVTARVCARRKGVRRWCSPVRLPKGDTWAAQLLPRRGRGRWRVEVIPPGQPKSSRGERAGEAEKRGPVVLATGDSMVETVESVLSDRLGNGARVVREIHPSTGLSRPDFDWPALARKQAARRRPAVTVVFVGVAEGFRMTTPSGDRVTCCDEPWVQEYTRRAAAMMRAYSRGGAGKVVWITVPASRPRDLGEIHTAVNRGVRQAAASENATVVNLDEVLTPGFQYRDEVTWGGRSVRVRADDGVHLSLGGARIAVDLLMDTAALSGLLD